MARADNKSPIRGTTITADDLNEKFSDITEATSGAIDGDNLRNEAVDQPHLVFTDSNSGAQGYVLKGYGEMSNGCFFPSPGAGGLDIFTNKVFSAGESNNPRHLDHTNSSLPGTSNLLDFSSDPLVLEYGDILRVYWDVEIKDMNHDINVITYPLTRPAATDTGVFWAVWLQWDITSSGLTNWTEVPNQTDFGTDLGGGILGGRVTNSNTSQATMLIPHSYLSGNEPLISGVGVVLAWAHKLDNTTFRQAWYYRHGGATTQVYGIRPVIDGIFQADSSPSVERSYLIIEDDWSGANSITVGNINMTAIHMQDS